MNRSDITTAKKRRGDVERTRGHVRTSRSSLSYVFPRNGGSSTDRPGKIYTNYETVSEDVNTDASECVLGSDRAVNRIKDNVTKKKPMDGHRKRTGPDRQQGEYVAQKKGASNSPDLDHSGLVNANTNEFVCSDPMMSPVAVLPTGAVYSASDLDLAENPPGAKLYSPELGQEMNEAIESQSVGVYSNGHIESHVEMQSRKNKVSNRFIDMEIGYDRNNQPANSIRERYGRYKNKAAMPPSMCERSDTPISYKPGTEPPARVSIAEGLSKTAAKLAAMAKKQIKRSDTIKFQPSELPYLGQFIVVNAAKRSFDFSTLTHVPEAHPVMRIRNPLFQGQRHQRLPRFDHVLLSYSSGSSHGMNARDF
ncbi:uncharacterized protein LOC127838553 [Dreissena polymorpha]|nr:uncharacterized protein LOC127838553 [Dreissena polymorpha]